MNLQDATKNLNALTSYLVGKPVALTLGKDDNGRINVTSNDLIQYLGIPLLSKLSIETFGSARVSTTGDEYWFDLKYRYKSLTSGENCLDFLSVTVNSEGEVTRFRSAGVENSIVRGSEEFDRVMRESQSVGIVAGTESDIILKALKADPEFNRCIDDNSDYIDIREHYYTDLAPSTEEYADVAVSIAITIDINNLEIYATATMNCDDMGSECDAFVSNALKAEVKEKIESDVARCQALLLAHGIRVTINGSLLEWFTGNEEDDNAVRLS